MRRILALLLAAALVAPSAFAQDVSNPQTDASKLTTGTLPSARIVALPNANLANSSTTVNGTTCTLGSTCVPAVVAGKTTKVTSSQTITRATGVKSVRFACTGAGGGGGGVANPGATAANQAQGGGSGSTSWVTINAPVADYVITIGAAGLAGVSGANTGGAGGDTTVTVNAVAVCVGKGGGGGASATAAPGAGGVAGTGDATFVGAPGGFAYSSASAFPMTAPYSASGGNSVWGGGAPNTVNGSVTAGSAATACGGGGGGASSINASGASAGSAGFIGCVVIDEMTNQ